MIELKSSLDKTQDIVSVEITVGGETFKAHDNEGLKELGTKITDKPFALEVFGEYNNNRYKNMKVRLIIQPVKSSNIGHFHWQDGFLYLTFKGKTGYTLYVYQGVSLEIALDLAFAESIGKEFGKVRSQLKDYVRIL